MGTTSYLPRFGLIHLCLVLVFSTLASAAFACTTGAWLAGAVGAVNPNDPNNGVARVKGFCGLEITGTGHVMDASPLDNANFVGHFYYLPKFTGGSGTTDLFVAYSNEAGTTELFSVKYDGTNIIFDATAATGTSVSFPADTTHWNLIEFSWNSGTTGSLWVNSDATIDPPDATYTPGTGLVQSVKLGAPNGFNGLVGSALIDEYVSHRDLPVGELLAGDANLDGNINSGDIDKVVTEFLSNTLAEGVIDCNLDGLVNSGDIDCVVKIFLNLP